MKSICLKALILFTLFCVSGKAKEVETENPMVLHPEWYIRITDWSFYAVFKTAIIHHVTIENTSDIAYKNIEVRVRYYSTSTSNYGTEVGQETGVLPIVLLPHSKKTYLKGGFVLGAGSSLFYAGNIEVLGAVPVTGVYEKPTYPKLTL